MGDAEQPGDPGMAPRLFADTVAGVTSRMARSAVDAPVAMLRVYCSCPGVSARMNFRRAVAKYR